jgi:anti-sigma factor RsiW
MSDPQQHDALNCKEIFSLLSEYIDGELPAGACQEVEQHIQDCEPCVKFMESLKKSVALVRGHEPAILLDEVPPSLREALLQVYRQKLQAQDQKPG